MESNDLGYFVSIYQKFAQAENKSKRTIEAVTACVKKFDGFLGGNTNPQNVTADDLRRYKKQEIGKQAYLTNSDIGV